MLLILIRVRVIRERLSASPGRVIGRGPAPGGGVVPCGGGSGGGGGDWPLNLQKVDTNYEILNKTRVCLTEIFQHLYISRNLMMLVVFLLLLSHLSLLRGRHRVVKGSFVGCLCFPAPWCGIAIVSWVCTYRDSVEVRSCW